MALILTMDQRRQLAKRKRARKLTIQKSYTREERDLRARMNKLWQRVLFPATEKIKEMVKRDASPVEIAEYLESVLEAAEFDYGINAEDISWRWRLSMDDATKQATQRALSKSLGVDLDPVLSAPEVADALKLAGMEAAGLIKSIPSEYISQAARAIHDNFVGRPLPDGRSLLEQLEHLSGVTKARAKLIARDQTAKLASSLNQVRQQSVGIDTYIWRTVRDERVTGNPSGLYPKGSSAHGNHYIMEGAYCRWDDASVYSDDKGKTWKARKPGMAKTHPGMEIQCRCWAEPVVDIEKIIAKSHSI